MTKRLSLTFSIILLISGLSWGAGLPTQKDLMTNLVEGLNWSFGLPDEPEPEDYLAILSGKRSLRIEAEEHLAETDLVSIKSYNNFGPFSGSGWVNGINIPTQLNLSFLLPISGRYSLSAALRLPDYTFEIGDQLFSADGGNHFEVVPVGEVELTAGPQKIVVELPTNGAIDFLDLYAPPLPNVEPLAGWSLDAPMTTSDLATTSLRVVDAEYLLPEEGLPRKLEAENAGNLAPTTLVKFRHLGLPSGDAWVRAGIASLTLELPFELQESTIIRFTLRGTGTGQTLEIDGDPAGSFDFPPYLENRTGPTRHLAAGKHMASVTLPPGCGLDLLELQVLSSSTEAFLELAGLSADLQAPSIEQLDKVIALLATLAPPR